MIAYLIRQSFKPGEVTPEEANQLGYEFARRFTKLYKMLDLVVNDAHTAYSYTVNSA